MILLSPTDRDMPKA